MKNMYYVKIKHYLDMEVREIKIKYYHILRYYDICNIISIHMVVLDPTLFLCGWSGQLIKHAQQRWLCHNSPG